MTRGTSERNREERSGFLDKLILKLVVGQRAQDLFLNGVDLSRRQHGCVVFAFLFSQ